MWVAWARTHRGLLAAASNTPTTSKNVVVDVAAGSAAWTAWTAVVTKAPTTLVVT